MVQNTPTGCGNNLPVLLRSNILAKNMTSQKYGQIVPTPCGSISHHTKPSQKPYNQKNRFLAISSNILISGISGPGVGN